MGTQPTNGWAMQEFANADLGDKRLNDRLIRLCDSLSESPESPINQACADWAETKAAYRFFKNENVEVDKILEAHCAKTAERVGKHHTVLAIQDTSYLIYTSHPQTTGLGKLTMKKGTKGHKSREDLLARVADAQLPGSDDGRIAAWTSRSEDICPRIGDRGGAQT